MKTETARLALRQEFPELIMEVEEYLSFADIEKLTETEVIEDFQEYMEK